MSKKISYKTIEREAQTLLVEKKSKFYASVKPVDNEADAIRFLQDVKSKYPDATHNVYAYVIDENNIFRYSDDGEPSGTAGMPVLDAIRKEGIVDAAVVVTRYFGGTLLGTGGLVRAYGASAKSGLEAGRIIERCLCNVIEIRVGYTLSGKVQYKISAENIMLEDTVYENDVTYKICCRINDTERMIKEFTDLTNGRAVCEVTDSRYVNVKL